MAWYQPLHILGTGYNVPVILKAVKPKQKLTDARLDSSY